MREVQECVELSTMTTIFSFSRSLFLTCLLSQNPNGLLTTRCKHDYCEKVTTAGVLTESTLFEAVLEATRA